MAPALHRHLRELPSVENGLRLWSNSFWRACANAVRASLNEVWRDLTSQRDPLPYNSDLMFLDLASERRRAPFSHPRARRETLSAQVVISDLGKAVLRGEARLAVRFAHLRDG